MQNVGFTVTLQIDPFQYQTILRELRSLRQLILSTIDDPAKLAAITEKLKTSEDALAAVVAQNQPQP